MTIFSRIQRLSIQIQMGQVRWQMAKIQGGIPFALDYGDHPL